ncbi:MAG: hypothetical protein GF328_08535 [Candidatus Latescibacteria bacterium]|nr:hypothetical protein [Candidatus Latescibacterota bacterium]
MSALLDERIQDLEGDSFVDATSSRKAAVSDLRAALEGVDGEEEADEVIEEVVEDFIDRAESGEFDPFR